jgi:thiamine pyrophosphate-dependent acetolactate synthase large subunit-like protein
MFAPVTKTTIRVKEPKEVLAAVQIAAFHALDAPTRPVYLEIPTDTLSEQVDGGHLQADVTDDRLRVPGPADLDAAAAVLAEAERPLIWAGGGALRSQAGPEVAMLAERLAAPVIETYQARGLLGPDHACSVGLPPHVRQVGELWDDADVVLAIGTDFDGMSTQNWRQPAPPRLITINVDGQDAAKAYPVEVNLVGDATRTAGALVSRVPAREGMEALEERLTAMRAEVRADLLAEQPDAVAFLDAFAGAVGDAVVVVDMCIPGYWLGAFHAVPRPRRLAYPVGWGTLGFGFPAALGSALAGVGRAVSVSGDGGFLFACGELATMAQERIPLTAVIVDDGGYGMLRYDQVQAGDATFGVDLHTPDFVALARSFGVEAEAVEGLGEDFGAALARHVAMDAPSVLVAAAQLDPPPSTSPRWYRKEVG